MNEKIKGDADNDSSDAKPVKRVVIKFGSGVLTFDPGQCLQVDRNVAFSVAAQMADAIDDGVEVIVVSSGAVALGVEELGLNERPEGMPQIQALAAVGQGLLMALWREAFGRKGLRVGQMLLTHSDLADRQRLLNVRATLDSLLEYGIVPVINENDTVMTDEITVGDNDNLATQVAKLSGAEMLVLLTAVDGILNEDGQVISVVAIEDEPETCVDASVSTTGRGGMGTKIASARAAAHGGITAVIANGKGPSAITDILAGKNVGTRFDHAPRALASRKHWIAYTLKPRGQIHVDAGAVQAIREKGASVLPVGVTSVVGDFDSGDLIQVMSPEGSEVGRGLTRTGAETLAGILGQKGEPVIHRDDFVIR
jgi:glutamate 5-kinase